MDLNTPEQETKRRPQGFQPGNSANPRGRMSAKYRADALFAELAAEMVGLSAVDSELLRQACALLVKAQSVLVKADVAVRCAGTGHRILTSLQRRYEKPRKAGRPPSTLSYAELARRDAADAAAKRAAELAADEISEMPVRAGSLTGEAGHELDRHRVHR